MERLVRTPLQGLTNILKFNWPFYALAVLGIAVLLILYWCNPSVLIILLAVGVLIAVLISLAVSFYIYDCSGLYTLTWLNRLNIKPGDSLVNIHAGFDETSALLVQKYSGCKLSVFDFYDPVKHTEASVARARKAYPAYPGTLSIQTNVSLVAATPANFVLLIFAAHEIRNTAERVVFFSELVKVLRPNGKIIVVEHLRDLPNLLAYNLGAFHFLSKQEWARTFSGAGLTIENEEKFTSFISIYTLKKNGDTS